LALFRISKALKEELRRQRSTIFGKKRYLFHLVSWLAALCYLLFSVLSDGFNKGLQTGMQSSDTGVISISETPLASVAIIGTLVGAVMVYFYLLYVIPFARYKRQRRYLWIGIFLNGGFWILAIIISAFFLGMRQGLKQPLDKNDTVLVLMLSTIFSGLTAGYFFSLYYFLDLYDQQKALNQYRQVLTEKLQAETSFLKMQINPHFLFNTLNNIYSLTLKHSEDAAKITRQLKDLISYMLYDCTRDKVPLSGEIAFLDNYIALEKLRNRQENITIDFRVKGDPTGKEIAPLLLINFIENAFKHGVKAGIEHAFVRIDLMIMDHTLALDVVNSKPAGQEQPAATVRQDGGIGIGNVRRRLAILYPDKHKLRISASERDFSVYLHINLKA